MCARRCSSTGTIAVKRFIASAACAVGRASADCNRLTMNSSFCWSPATVSSIGSAALMLPYSTSGFSGDSDPRRAIHCSRRSVSQHGHEPCRPVRAPRPLHRSAHRRRGDRPRRSAARGARPRAWRTGDPTRSDDARAPSTTAAAGAASTSDTAASRDLVFASVSERQPFPPFLGESCSGMGTFLRSGMQMKTVRPVRRFPSSTQSHSTSRCGIWNQC